MTHLTTHQLRRWRDAPDESDRASIVGHLAVCDACANRFAELMRAAPADAATTASLPIEAFVTRGQALAPASARWNLGQLAMAATVFVALGLAVWQAIEARRLQQQVTAIEAQSRAREDRAAQQVREEQARRESLERELEQERRARPAVPVLSLFLTAGRTRGDGGRTASITIRDNTADVRLDLSIEGASPFAAYEAEIVNADGTRVWQGRAATRSERSVTVPVPAAALTQDDYEVVLHGTTRAGATERIGQYYFRVLR